MERVFYPQLRETVCRQRLENGLQVVILPRPGFSKKVAYFVTNYGSMQRRFTMDGKTVEAPMGVAHFLEHKLFDMPQGDISPELAALGASSNAFTSFDMTAYYFSCTENFRQCLQLLLQFVTTPYFTPESVQKEQGIIGQEIDMNLDSPETRIFENLTRAMYASHPIREPILGTRESIAEITPQLLTDCHRAFYRPENMMVCVIADEDPQQLLKLIRQETAHMPCPQVQVLPNEPEPEHTLHKRVTDTMEVAMPMFQVGFKCSDTGTGEEAVYREFVADIAAEALFGESSRLYLQLYEQGLIDSSFGGGFETIQGMAMLTASGDSENADRVVEAILAEAQRICREGIPEEDFQRILRSSVGRRIRSLDSFDATCFRICAYHFSNFDYFQFPALCQRVKAEDVYAFLQQAIRPECCSLSVIYPKEAI